MAKLISSYDIIGSREKAVAIVEIPKELKNQEKQIAKQILRRHRNVKTVLKKLSERRGKYRTRKYKLLVGVKDTEVLHKESNCLFKLDPKKVYFSVREGTERLRIAKKVKPNERVMVMFSGVGPFPIIIAKYQPKVKEIISIEINPKAYRYMKENIRINKFQQKIIPVLGDVKTKAKKWYGKCDRIVMPLPLESWKFFNIALKCLKPKGGIIHLYMTEREESIKKQTENKTNRYRKKFKIIYKIRKVLPYAPSVNKYCVDMKIRTM